MNVSIKGKGYSLESKGELSVQQTKFIKNQADLESFSDPFEDSILIQDKNGQTFKISADELDIDGTFLRPFVGLPDVGDQISFFDEKTNTQVVGRVVGSYNPSDTVTRVHGFISAATSVFTGGCVHDTYEPLERNFPDV